MGVQIEAKQTQSTMIRLVNGKLVKEEASPNIYIVPPKDMYEFDVTGYAIPFEMPRDPEYGGGTQTMTRVELTITEGKGKGRMFTQMWGFSIHPKSNLGIFLRKLSVPIPIVGGFDLDEMIAYGGRGYVVPSDKLGDDGKPKYAKLSLDTVEGTKVRDQAYSFDGDLELAGISSNGNRTQAAVTDDGWPDE